MALHRQCQDMGTFMTMLWLKIFSQYLKLNVFTEQDCESMMRLALS